MTMISRSSIGTFFHSQPAVLYPIARGWKPHRHSKKRRAGTRATLGLRGGLPGARPMPVATSSDGPRWQAASRIRSPLDPGVIQRGETQPSCTSPKAACGLRPTGRVAAGSEASESRLQELFDEGLDLGQRRRSGGGDDRDKIRSFRRDHALVVLPRTQGL